MHPAPCSCPHTRVKSQSQSGSEGHGGRGGEENSQLKDSTLMSVGVGLAVGTVVPLVRPGGRGGCSARKSASPESGPAGS